MNVKHIESIIRFKICPACSVGMTREIGHRVYQCGHTRCGETFDFSHISDSMIYELLERGKAAQPAKRKIEKSDNPKP